MTASVVVLALIKAVICAGSVKEYLFVNIILLRYFLQVLLLWMLFIMAFGTTFLMLMDDVSYFLTNH